MCHFLCDWINTMKYFTFFVENALCESQYVLLSHLQSWASTRWMHTIDFRYKAANTWARYVSLTMCEASERKNHKTSLPGCMWVGGVVKTSSNCIKNINEQPLIRFPRNYVILYTRNRLPLKSMLQITLEDSLVKW